MAVFDLNPEYQEFRDTIRRFARERIAPGAAERDRTHEHPSGLVRDLADIGALGITIDLQYGGLGLDMVAQVMILEEIAYADAALGSIVAGHYLGLEAIRQCGTEEQKKKYLPPLADGTTRIAFALTEPDAGSDVAGLRTRAVRDGAGAWRITGTKTFTSNADVADHMVVFARTEDSPGINGISAFVVPTSSKGVTLSSPIPKMGMHSEHAYEVSFDNVHVLDSQALDPPGAGGRRALNVLNNARIDTAAVANGVATRALDLAFDYANQREQFGQPIAKFQAIQLSLGRMDALTAAARLATYDAAQAAASGLDTRRRGAIAKYIASENCCTVVDLAVQIHGGYGYVTESEVERLYREARLFKIYEGTSDIQLLTIYRMMAKERIP